MWSFDISSNEASSGSARSLSDSKRKRKAAMPEWTAFPDSCVTKSLTTECTPSDPMMRSLCTSSPLSSKTPAPSPVTCRTADPGRISRGGPQDAFCLPSSAVAIRSSSRCRSARCMVSVPGSGCPGIWMYGMEFSSFMSVPRKTSKESGRQALARRSLKPRCASTRAPLGAMVTAAPTFSSDKAYFSRTTTLWPL